MLKESLPGFSVEIEDGLALYADYCQRLAVNWVECQSWSWEGRECNWDGLMAAALPVARRAFAWAKQREVPAALNGSYDAGLLDAVRES